MPKVDSGSVETALDTHPGYRLEASGREEFEGGRLDDLPDPRSSSTSRGTAPPSRDYSCSCRTGCTVVGDAGSIQMYGHRPSGRNVRNVMRGE
jgi:hypothetical protein